MTCEKHADCPECRTRDAERDAGCIQLEADLNAEIDRVCFEYDALRDRERAFTMQEGVIAGLRSGIEYLCGTFCGVEDLRASLELGQARERVLREKLLAEAEWWYKRHSVHYNVGADPTQCGCEDCKRISGLRALLAQQREGK